MESAVHSIPLTSILINRESRQRREITTDDLEPSIAKYGLIEPIIIQKENNLLIAGERRLEACRKLGHANILVRYMEELSEIDRTIIEFEENNKRRDLSWKETVRTVAYIHNLYESLNPSWTITATANALSISLGATSLYLQVASMLSDPRVEQCRTAREAYNLLARREQRAMGDALQDLLFDEPTPSQIGVDPEIYRIWKDVADRGIAESNKEQNPIPAISSPPSPSILNTSFLSWAPAYSGPKFNLIHCDFPYGILHSAGPQGRQGEPNFLYDDSESSYFALLDCLCDNFYRLMSVSGHLLFWYSRKLESETLLRLSRLPHLKFSAHPLIWHKTDNVGIASDPRRFPRHTYETCLFATIGNRQAIRVVSDSYGSPTDNRLHPTTKPEPVLKHFLSSIVDESTTLLDPTCGSASALRAADILGAKSVLGLEIDSDVARMAEIELSNSRRLRGAKIERRIATPT